MWVTGRGPGTSGRVDRDGESDGAIMRVTATRRLAFFFIGDLFLTILTLALSVRIVLGAWPAAAPAWALPYLTITLLARFPLFLVSGVYRISWRHLGLPDLIQLGYTFATSGAVLLATNLIWGFPGLPSATATNLIVLETLGSMVAIGLFRVSRRLATQHRRPRGGSHTKKAILIGAGVAGEHVLRGLRDAPATGPEVVAILDDDPLATGLRIHGCPVVGPIDRLAELLAQHPIDQVLVAIPTARRGLIRRITEDARAANVDDVRVFPHMHEVLDGRLEYATMRRVDLRDLLGRASVDVDQTDLKSLIGGRRVLVTGAAGTIGSELCRQLVSYGPAALAFVDVDETRIHDLDLDLRALVNADVELTPWLCDVSSAEDVDRTFATFRPELVFHAAAYKHVPVMERHPDKAFRVNVLGTYHVTRSAVDHNVAKLVFISTDKAVQPTSVMGATKRIAEKVVSVMAERHSVAFLSVRFGNVIGSRGSVIPLFERQIRDGGPLTVTHPDMERYFMLTSEAVLLVLQASSDGRGNEVFVLDMGERVRILDIAREMIRLSGFEPERDIPIAVTGIRPGEKLKEELLLAEEGTQPTSREKIMRACVAPVEPHYIDRVLDVANRLSELSPAALRREIETLVSPTARLGAEVPEGTSQPLPRIEVQA